MAEVIEKFYSRLQEEGLELKPIKYFFAIGNGFTIDGNAAWESGKYFGLEVDPANVKDQMKLSADLELKLAFIDTTDGSRITVNLDRKPESRIAVGYASHNERKIVDKVSKEIEW